MGDTEFDADACQAGVSDADEGDDSQIYDVDSCDSDATQRGVNAEAERLEAVLGEAADSDSDADEGDDHGGGDGDAVFEGA